MNEKDGKAELLMARGGDWDERTRLFIQRFPTLSGALDYIEKLEKNLLEVGDAQNKAVDRYEKAEAELAEKVKLDAQTLKTLFEWRERVRLAEAEVATRREDAERHREQIMGLWQERDSLKAEVERLNKHLLVHGCTDSFCSNPKGGGRESGEEPPEAGCSEPAAAEPAAPSLSARKATRKTGHYHVEFDPNCSACRFAADPAARKERDGR